MAIGRVLVTALAAALVACNTSGLPAVRSSPTVIPTPVRTAAPTPAPEAMSARTFLDALQASGLPVSNMRVLSAENDPNALLGKPGQYVAKVFWTDTRVQTGQPTAEMFVDDQTMQARFEYLDAIFKTQPAGFQYMYRNDARRVLLRVPQSLTPSQAGEYEVWLKKL